MEEKAKSIVINQKIEYSISSKLDFPMPDMWKVRQKFDTSHVTYPYEETIRTLKRLHMPDLTGKRVGITAGSRQIANFAQILRAVAAFLRSREAQPFIIPAMGSHGNATAEGQLSMLEQLGITEKELGIPIISEMDVVVVGAYEDGSSFVCAKTAVEADYVVVCGRIKAHTSIKAPIESGLCKMMTVGLGKHQGATNFHRHGYPNLAALLPQGARACMSGIHVLCGLAMVENAYDETLIIEAIEPERIIQRERELLAISKCKMPRFFLDQIDVLIVERFGKDISGAGMDPNITGRDITPLPMTAPVPIGTIVMLGLTQAAKGNAAGIGGVEITTRKVIESMDLFPTYTNVFTNGAFLAAKLPVILNDDEEAIRMAIACAPKESVDQVKIVRIRDTLHMSEIDVSENCLEMMQKTGNVEVLGPSPMRFNQDKELIMDSWSSG